jgi:hypothetical protein
MGLDIYFERVNKIDYQFEKKKNNVKELETEEVAYFRKVNCLLPFFGYEDDCSTHPIEKCQIEDLVDTAKELLTIYGTFNAQLQLYKVDLESYKSDEKKTKLIYQKINNLWQPFETAAQEKLPTTKGFFFGSTEYREWYVADLKDIVETFTKVLDETDFDTDQILMYCWW